jgi:hypothetical protein
VTQDAENISPPKLPSEKQGLKPEDEGVTVGAAENSA